MKYLTSFFVLLSPLVLVAQLAIPAELQWRLDTMQADIFRPLDSDFRPVKVDGEDYVPAQFAMYSKREKLEIRYYARPKKELGFFAQMPHLDASRVVMNAASNDEDAVTTGHSFGTEDRKTFGADWAKLFTFPPKRGFSDTQYAQMVAIYRENQGMIYIFLLFNDAPDTLDARQIAARFLQ